MLRSHCHIPSFFFPGIIGALVLIPTISLAEIAQDVNYTVSSGDTLWGIAQVHNISVEQLLELNPTINSSTVIYPEQQIVVARSEVTPISCELLAAASVEPVLVPIPTDVPDSPEPEQTETQPLIFADRVSDAFEAKVIEISERIGVDPDHLMAVMYFETGGTFRSSIRNPRTRAVGLIQFLPSTARRLGTTDDQLAQMSEVDQLDWVETYYSALNQDSFEGLEDTYMGVFYPVAVGQSQDYVLFRRGSSPYRNNPGLDRNNDGAVTKEEVSIGIRRIYQRGLSARSASDG